jgi:hypothetical protein
VIQPAFDLPQSKRALACEALARDVERRKHSFETRDYIKRRTAALKAARLQRAT